MSLFDDKTILLIVCALLVIVNITLGIYSVRHKDIKLHIGYTTITVIILIYLIVYQGKDFFQGFIG